jgi:CRP-like cAMP-binding protein
VQARPLQFYRAMPRRSGKRALPANRFLTSLSRDDLASLSPHLRTVSVGRGQVFHQAGDRIDQLFFLSSGVASLNVITTDGDSVQVGAIGNEGVTGIEALVDGRISTVHTTLQVPGGEVQVIQIAPFRRVLKARPGVRKVAYRYLQGFIATALYSNACLAAHTAPQRCCRWLLHTHDRVGGDHFCLSHEALAKTLGTTRPTTSMIAKALQRSGAITYRHGHVTIVNRAALEAGACECYAALQGHLCRLGL